MIPSFRFGRNVDLPRLVHTHTHSLTRPRRSGRTRFLFKNDSTDLNTTTTPHRPPLPRKKNKRGRERPRQAQRRPRNYVTRARGGGEQPKDHDGIDRDEGDITRFPPSPSSVHPLPQTLPSAPMEIHKTGGNNR